MYHVGVVDDEKELLFSLNILLEAEGWKVSTFSDAEDALLSFEKEMPDIIVMDILMPGKDGLWLCGEVRKRSAAVPIIFLSAKVEEIDRIIGLESGGDDYLGKPFSTQELIVRIKVQKRRQDYLRQSEGQVQNELTPTKTDGFTLDPHRMSLECSGKVTPLTLSEFRILDRLMNAPDSICTREDLLNRVYSEDIFLNDRVIDNHIRRIRSKLAGLCDKASFIDTVYGIGYRWRRL